MKKLMTDAFEVLSEIDGILNHMPEHVEPKLQEYRTRLEAKIGRMAQEEAGAPQINSMTAKEFRDARVSLQMSQSHLGKILNTHPRTIRKWEQDDGTRPPNPIACRVIEWMLAGYMPPMEGVE